MSVATERHEGVSTNFEHFQGLPEARVKHRWERRVNEFARSHAIFPDRAVAGYSDETSRIVLLERTAHEDSEHTPRARLGSQIVGKDDSVEWWHVMAIDPRDNGSLAVIAADTSNTFFGECASLLPDGSIVWRAGEEATEVLTMVNAPGRESTSTTRALAARAFPRQRSFVSS